MLHFEKEGKALFWRGFSISWGKFIPSHLGKCPRVRDRLRDEETRGGAGFGGCGPRPRLAAWRARKPASPSVSSLGRGNGVKVKRPPPNAASATEIAVEFGVRIMFNEMI